MTAYNSSDIADRAKELNVSAYLTKPFIISEFRQIVRSTLEPPQEHIAADTASAFPQLTPEQSVAVGRLLGTLRTMTGADAALLTHSSGTVVAVDAVEERDGLKNFGAELEAIQRTMNEQLRATFDRDCTIKQTYFGTDTVGVCAYRLDDSYAAAVVFGSMVKEGQVWYYLREASATLRTALADREPELKDQRSGARGDVFELLQEFFPDKYESAASPAPIPPTDNIQEIAQPEAAASADLPSIDAINWDVDPDANWDTVAEQSTHDFQGLTLEEAQSQGLLPKELAEPATGTAAKEIERPPVDEIDWEIDTNLDWDAMVNDTDKGLGGLSFEDAQNQGLIDDLSE
jgi:hypothetical protein